MLIATLLECSTTKGGGEAYIAIHILLTVSLYYSSSVWLDKQVLQLEIKIIEAIEKHEMSVLNSQNTIYKTNVRNKNKPKAIEIINSF